MSHCPKHPDAVATDLCVECGEFVCGQCAFVTSDQRVFCPACQHKAALSPPPRPAPRSVPRSTPAPPPRPSRPRVAPPAPAPYSGRAATKNSKAAIASLILPFACFCYGAPFGLALALRENALIKKGRSSSSAGLVKASIWINAIVLALLALGMILGHKG